MNRWTQISIDLANQRDYLDQLFRVYPTVPDNVRDIDADQWQRVENALNGVDDVALITAALALPLFPIKDSYISYLRKDRSALERNPETVHRIAARLRAMGPDEIFKVASQPKETNRQIGPMFKDWVRKRTITSNIVTDEDDLIGARGNVIFDGSDESCKNFAYAHLGYQRDKGIDLLAKFNGQYVIGEVKFLTDMGGHQNAQFEDAISLLTTNLTANANAVKIAVLDGVLYIPGRHKMRTYLTDNPEQNIVSALVLREFLYAL